MLPGRELIAAREDFFWKVVKPGSCYFAVGKESDCIELVLVIDL